MNKHEMRLQARAHRKQLGAAPEDLERLSTLFFDHFDLPAGSVVAAYWPAGSELDVRYLIDDLIRRGYRICLPDLASPAPGVPMRFRHWDGREVLKPSVHGKFLTAAGAEAEPDVLLIPLLAFDRRGGRLGQGGGHYDATLAELRRRKEIVAIGVGYGEQAVLFNLPVEDHDERLDFVITPVTVHDFR